MTALHARAKGNAVVVTSDWRHNTRRELGTVLDHARARFHESDVGAREFAAFFAPRLQFFCRGEMALGVGH